MNFLGGEAVGVCIGEGAPFAEGVAVGIVKVFGDDDLVGVDEGGDVAAAVGVVKEGVSDEWSVRARRLPMPSAAWSEPLRSRPRV